LARASKALPAEQQQFRAIITTNVCPFIPAAYCVSLRLAFGSCPCALALYLCSRACFHAVQGPLGAHSQIANRNCSGRGRWLPTGQLLALSQVTTHQLLPWSPTPNLASALTHFIGLLKTSRCSSFSLRWKRAAKHQTPTHGSPISHQLGSRCRLLPPPHTPTPTHQSRTWGSKGLRPGVPSGVLN
jgi:hypothetical protein